MTFATTFRAILGSFLPFRLPALEHVMHSRLADQPRAERLVLCVRARACVYVGLCPRVRERVFVCARACVYVGLCARVRERVFVCARALALRVLCACVRARACARCSYRQRS